MIREIYGEGENSPPTLLQVLSANLPKHQSSIIKGSVSVVKLASDLAVSRETIYRMLRANEIRSSYVNKFISLHGSTLTIEKLTPYVNFG